MSEPVFKRRRLEGTSLASPAKVQANGHSVAHAAPLSGASSSTSQPRPCDVSRPLASQTKNLQYLNERAQERIICNALAHPVTQELMAKWIDLEYTNKINYERSRVIDFDHHSKTVWYAINKKYKPSRGSREYEMAFDAIDEVTEAIEAIGRESGPEKSFGTRQNALVTLQKIGKSIALSGRNICGHDVRKYFQHDESLEDMIYDIIESMSSAERESMRTLDEGEFVEKIEELLAIADGPCLFQGLVKSLRLLQGINPRQDETEDGLQDGYNEDIDADDSVETDEELDSKISALKTKLASWDETCQAGETVDASSSGSDVTQ